jgi:hypothetical protein
MANSLVGKQDYLFLTNDANRLIDQHTGLHPFETEIRAIYEVHLMRVGAVRMANAGAYVHVIVPNKETVARDLLPDGIVYQQHGLTPVRKYLAAAKLAEHMTFFRPEALSDFLAQRYYYRYDTHWTSRGAIVYMLAMFRAFGMGRCSAALAALELQSATDLAPGDLGSKIGRTPEGAELLTPAHPRAACRFTNGPVDVGCVRHYVCEDAPVPVRVLVLHDSTALWLMSILPELFPECMMIHTPDVDLDFVARYKPDIMLFLQIERFFVRPPSNQANYAEFIAGEQDRKGATANAVAYLRAGGYL